MAKVPPALSKYLSEMGKKGGEIGGKRRAEGMTAAQRQRSAKKAGQAAAMKLTPAERSARAKKAAQARWAAMKKKRA